jgi:catechol 2,3-dioxygenase-like lactoylglutathione lyase family enzyme
MLADYPIHATLPATDLERAKRFYTEKLGLTAESEAPEGVFYRSGDTRFLVFPSGGTASGTHTQLSWTVDEIEAEVAALKARGVAFEEYDFPELSTINSVATMGPVKIAWMKDSEGNLLSVAQVV